MELLSEIVQSNNDLIDEKAAAEILAISPGTLSVWRSTGREKLAYIKVGSCVRYSRKALQEYLESRTRVNGSTS